MFTNTEVSPQDDTGYRLNSDCLFQMQSDALLIP